MLERILKNLTNMFFEVNGRSPEEGDEIIVAAGNNGPVDYDWLFLFDGIEFNFVREMEYYNGCYPL